MGKATKALIPLIRKHADVGRFALVQEPQLALLNVAHGRADQFIDGFVQGPIGVTLIATAGNAPIADDLSNQRREVRLRDGIPGPPTADEARQQYLER